MATEHSIAHPTTEKKLNEYEGTNNGLIMKAKKCKQFSLPSNDVNFSSKSIALVSFSSE